MRYSLLVMLCHESRVGWPDLTTRIRRIFATAFLLAMASQAFSQGERLTIDYQAAIAGSRAPHSKSFLPGK